MAEGALILAIVALVVAALGSSRAERAEAAARRAQADLEALRREIAAIAFERPEREPVERMEATVGELAGAELAGAREGPAEALATADEPLAPSEPELAQRPEPKPTVEQAIGLVWVTRIGAALLVVGVIYFFQLAIERGWLGPWGRVGVGLAVGASAVGLAAYLRARTSAAWVAVLVGLGLAVALGAVWAAHALYHLVPGLAAFAAVTGLVIGAGALAASWRMEAILGTAVTSAFVNLGALSDGLPGHASLVGYALVLGGASLLVAVPRRWSVVAMVIGPGAALAYAMRHFGIIGQGLGPSSTADTALAVGLALALGAALTNGAERLPSRAMASVQVGAGLFGTGVAATLWPLAGFAALALAALYRGFGVARARTGHGSGSALAPLHASVFAVGLVGLGIAAPTAALALWAGLGVAIALAARAAAGERGDGGAARVARAELGLVAGLVGVTAAVTGEVSVAAAGAGAGVLGAIALGLRRDVCAGLAASLALGLMGVTAVVGRPTAGLEAAILGGLGLLGAAAAGLLARREPAVAAFVLAGLGLAVAADRKDPGLAIAGGLALAALPALARRAALPARAAAAARVLGLAALGAAALGLAGKAFDDGGGRTVAETVGLGLFGAAVLAWGFVRASVLDRWIGLALLGVAVGKLTLKDVFELDTVPRTLILILVGVLLLGAGFLYARGVSKKPPRLRS